MRLHQLFTGLEIAVDGRPLAVTASVGFTACDEQKTLFFDSLLAQAEAALEFAAARGGNQVISFGETQLRAEGDSNSAAKDAAPPRRRASDRQDGEHS